MRPPSRPVNLPIDHVLFAATSVSGGRPPVPGSPWSDQRGGPDAPFTVAARSGEEGWSQSCTKIIYLAASPGFGAPNRARRNDMKVRIGTPVETFDGNRLLPYKPRQLSVIARLAGKRLFVGREAARIEPAIADLPHQLGALPGQRRTTREADLSTQ